VTYAIYYFIAVSAIAGVSSIVQVGQHRKPTTPVLAAATVVLVAVHITLYLWILGGLHG
jgi:hypothetical protein